MKKLRMLPTIALAMLVSTGASAGWLFPDSDIDLIQGCNTTPIGQMTKHHIELT